MRNDLTKPLLALFVLTVALMLFMAYVAVRNSRPFVCNDKYIQMVNAEETCVVPINQINQGINY